VTGPRPRRTLGKDLVDLRVVIMSRSRRLHARLSPIIAVLELGAIMMLASRLARRHTAAAKA
jgi:hypothetical protein